MSSGRQTPQEAGAPELSTREITVSVPEERVEQFEAFVERFLSGEGRRYARGDRRERHLRRALFHLVMAHGGPEGGRGRCSRRKRTKAQADPASVSTL